MQTLTWIETTHGDPQLDGLWSFLQEHVERLAAGRVTTRYTYLSVATGGIRTQATRLLNDAAVLATSLEAQSGSDGLILGCWGAPTVAVRSAVDIPMTSLTDGVARSVGSLARRAAVVTVSETLAPMFADDLAAHGASSLLPNRPVRGYEPESTHAEVLDAIADPGSLIDRFDAAATRAVDEGADAIVVGCAYLAPIFTAHGYTRVRRHPDVSVLDCNRIAFEHALQLMSLHEHGIRPSARGYVRPEGARARTLAGAAGLLRPMPEPLMMA